MSNKFVFLSLTILFAALLLATTISINLMLSNRKLSEELASLRERQNSPSEKKENVKISGQTAIEQKTSDKSGPERERLLKEVAALKSELARKNAEIAKLSSEKSGTPVAAQAPDPRGGPGRGGDFMERMKKEDPQRYEEMRTRLNDMVKHIQDKSNDQESFFASIDTSVMDETQFENHNKLVEMLKNNAELAAKINADPDSEEANQLRREMFSNFRDMRELFDSERNAALNSFGKSLGYNESDAKAFTEYINYLNNMTSIRSYFGGGGFWGGGGGQRDRQ